MTGRRFEARPLLRVVLNFDGMRSEERAWTINDTHIPKPGIEPWMVSPSRAWDHPQDPITLAAWVSRENEAVALAWLEAL